MSDRLFIRELWDEKSAFEYLESNWIVPEKYLKIKGKVDLEKLTFSSSNYEECRFTVNMDRFKEYFFNGKSDGSSATGVKAKGTTTLSGQPTVSKRAVGRIFFNDQPVASVRSQGTWTFADQPAADDTLEIGVLGATTTFVFKATATSGTEIDIGANLSDTLDNAVTKINAHSTVAALGLSLKSGSTIVFTAKIVGTVPNAYVFDESGTDITADGSGTLGGTTAGAFNDYLEMGETGSTVKFYFCNDSGATGNEIEMGGDAEATINASVSKINANGTISALLTVTKASASILQGTAVAIGTEPNAYVYNASGANFTVASGTLNNYISGTYEDFIETGATGSTVKFYWSAASATNAATLGGTVEISIDNAVTKINADGTISALMTAAKGSATTLTLEADVAGTAGNAYELDTTGTNLSADGSGNLGGTTPGRDGSGSGILALIATMNETPKLDTSTPPEHTWADHLSNSILFTRAFGSPIVYYENQLSAKPNDVAITSLTSDVYASFRGFVKGGKTLEFIFSTISGDFSNTATYLEFEMILKTL